MGTKWLSQLAEFVSAQKVRERTLWITKAENNHYRRDSAAVGSLIEMQCPSLLQHTLPL